MAPPSRATANDLPNEVLATIFKFAADLPPFAFDRMLPFPVVAGRISCQWRTVALGYPELWTTIRIFDNSRSCHWAALFTQRSKNYPLDISINVQSSDDVSCALAIVGPHIARWRTLAFRGWTHRLTELEDFVLQSPLAPSRLEALHLDEVILAAAGVSDSELASVAKTRVTASWYNEWKFSLDGFFVGGHLQSLRVAADVMQPSTLVSFSGLHSLDIDCRDSYWPGLRQLLGASSAVLTTLVLRGFGLRGVGSPDEHPTIAGSIRLLSIRFARAFWWYKPDPRHKCDLESLTSRFSFSNLESLEIVDGFSGADDEEKNLRVPEPWEAPLFGPHLRNLRLESVGFSRRGLALIESFSPDITHLELIHITRNAPLVAHNSRRNVWPALRALTVEATGILGPKWIAAFLVVRAVNLQRRITELRLSPWKCGIVLNTVPPESRPALYWQRSGPSAGLTEAVFSTGTKFYLDYDSMRVVDFEDQWDVKGAWDAWTHRTLYPWTPEDDLNRLEEEIQERLRMHGTLVRWKDRPRALKRYEVRRLAQEHKPKVKTRRRRCDLREDFCVV
ncbi:hypothetical protein C8R46DRAFT_1287365 [Mycena filopes]|nr:hypothetical protein C8R46DRAFT_1287365 [Mycena filopes]